MDIKIRKAKPQEHEILTEISFAAKRYWDYPQEYFDVWKDELTISEDYIKNNIVFAAEADATLAAYYSVVEVKQDFMAGRTKVEKGFWLEHMFVLPKFIGGGIGGALYAHMKDFCNDNGIAELRIFADPNAKGFYEKMGAVYIEERPSSIEGRTVSLFMEKM
jgi:GNAT superfamily N-acetyltransferase